MSLIRLPRGYLPKLLHDDVALCQVRDFETLPYALVHAEDGWVVLNRHYRLFGSSRPLGEWRSTDGKLQFVRDPRLEAGLFILVVEDTGWLYNSQYDSSADYLERLRRLIALKEGCLSRC